MSSVLPVSPLNVHPLDFSLCDELVFREKKHLDLFWIIENEEATQRYIKHTPIRHLHPTDTEKKMFNYAMKTSPKLMELFDKIFQYDNPVAFSHIIKRFGFGVGKRKCENLLKKIIDNNALKIMHVLISMGIDLKQGDHIAIRYAKHVQKKNMDTDNKMVDLLTASGGTIGIEKSIRKFQTCKPRNMK